MEPAEEIEYYDAEYADGGEPFATFHFYYRSLGKFCPQTRILAD
jgi:hypothetical protein